MDSLPFPFFCQRSARFGWCGSRSGRPWGLRISSPSAARSAVLSRGSVRPNPVAMTVIMRSPSMLGSMTEPKMTFASSPAALVTTLAASLTSNSVMSRPPVMLTSTPSAPAIETSSSSGLDTACCAASSARF